MIPAAQQTVLAPCFHRVRFAAGDVLTQAGEKPKELLIITAGAVEVTVAGPSGPQVVYRMSPGETLGAVGLVTDVVNAATATALTPVQALRISRAGLDAAIADQLELAEALRNMAAGTATAMVHQGAVTGSVAAAQPTLFLSRLRSFLQVLDS